MNINEEKRIPLCCEICIKNEKDISNEIIKVAAHKWLFSLGITITLGRHDPNKIMCEKLSNYCEYIVIEPAVPIKIVKEYNENCENNIYGTLYTTHYSVYETNSHININDNKKDIDNINILNSYEKKNYENIYNDNNLKLKKQNTSNGFNTSNLVSSLATTQSIAYSFPMVKNQYLPWKKIQ
ncbi:hypothetical protein [Plasmodium yoelii yoelii]|uniref:Uncharacterized protein n=1 Tax=Plasmodium yoelii yoelii TaxID=73239 RepID=Q7RMW0_PLAYO|nr:hypothetical protein [Plasmodium yoelii yoelii]